MTMNNRRLWLVAAGTIAFAMSCGGGGDTPDSGSNTCSNDAACGSGKACHPVLKTCVATCTGASDCPAAEKTCAKINNSAASYCTCSTDALCSMTTTGNICNQATSQCSAKCTSNSNCPSGFSCNTTTGQCAAGGTDAGTDAGVDAGVTCDYSIQPDVCGYGNVCNGSNACEPIVNGTCANVANHGAWNASTSTGPVIYNVIDEMQDDQSKCAPFPDGGLPTPFTLTIGAYRGSLPFPPQKSNLPGFFYYTSSGTANDIPLNFLQQSNYSTFADGGVMSAKFTLCGASGLSSITAGFGFTGGNAACATLTH
jgi:Cys-rich repeat protein